jgi:hypothetical protein
MIVAWFLTLTSLFIGSVTANCSSNRTCLEIVMSDFFHDGWDGAEVYVETPWGDVLSSAPTCAVDPKIETLCTDQSGDYPMVLIHEDETYTPKNYWEVSFVFSFPSFLHSNPIGFLESLCNRMQ